MKKLIVILFFAISQNLDAQNNKYIGVSYLGETITHGGIKAGISFLLTDWEVVKVKKNKTLQYHIDFRPNIGFFHHKAYQTSVFVLPELSFTKKRPSGNYQSIGVGLGYLRTFVPNVFEVDIADDIQKTNAGYNYLLSNYFVVFGRDLSVKSQIPVALFIKPQMMMAYPNQNAGIWYFALELGFDYKLTKEFF